ENVSSHLPLTASLVQSARCPARASRCAPLQSSLLRLPIPFGCIPRREDAGGFFEVDLLQQHALFAVGQVRLTAGEERVDAIPDVTRGAALSRKCAWRTALPASSPRLSSSVASSAFAVRATVRPQVRDNPQTTPDHRQRAARATRPRTR